MIKHIVLWKLKSEFSDEEKAEKIAAIKANLEGLNGKIPGLIKLSVIIDKLSVSTCDLMLYSEFESEEALMGYRENPLHQNVAKTHVRPNLENRLSMDYNA